MEDADDDLLEACGITDLDHLARQCTTVRKLLGKPTARWTALCLAVVINLAVVVGQAMGTHEPAEMEARLARDRRACDPPSKPRPALNWPGGHPLVLALLDIYGKRYDLASEPPGSDERADEPVDGGSSSAAARSSADSASVPRRT